MSALITKLITVAYPKNPIVLPTSSRPLPIAFASFALSQPVASKLTILNGIPIANPKVKLMMVEVVNCPE